MALLDRLNPQQKEAVLHTDGPLLILAGAGSGKTRVIISRIAHLIQEHGVAPWSILAVTFTNKAASEMRERVQLALSAAGQPPSATPMVATFHSFCVRVLRSHGKPLAEVRPGFTPQFNIYDSADQVAVLKNVYKAIGIDDKTFMKPRAALSIISQGKNQGQGPQDFYKQATSPQAEKMAVVFERYQEALQSANALDFDDLLLEAVRLLRRSPETREQIGGRYKYVMVDEYQDTNRPQYELLRLLTESHDNVCVVGDEDQSIYSWRGAEIRNILDFERDFPGAKAIRLEQNYRSTKRILEAASVVVANNEDRKGKNFWTDGDEGDKIAFYQGSDAEAEALFVADELNTYLTENPDSRAAVLYRTNAQSRQIEEALRRYGRKYTVVGGLSFYQRAEVKDLIAYLKLATTPTDLVCLMRVINTPARGIGKTTFESLQQLAQEENVSVWEAINLAVDHKKFPARAHAALKVFRHLIERMQEKIETEPVNQALLWIYEETGYRRILETDPSVEAQARQENVKELLNAAADAAQREETVQDFLDHAALVSETDKIEDSSRILLMTLHNAKGLEFPWVALIGMEETLFPHSRSLEDPTALEEERRLCYVGMTRAEQKLYLTCARTRRRFGGGAPDWMTPSRFLREVPPILIDDRTVGGSELFVLKSKAAKPADGVDVFGEQSAVRQMAESRLARGSKMKGETYNSADAVAGFFQKRGIPFNQGAQQPAGKPASRPTATAPQRPAAARPAAKRPGGGIRNGARVRHAKYGLGTILRREGDGEAAKVTINFQRHGLKKMILKYAKLQPA